MIKKVNIPYLHCKLCGYLREWRSTDNESDPCPACQDGNPRFWETRKPNLK